MNQPKTANLDNGSRLDELPELPALPNLGPASPTRQQASRRRGIAFIVGVVWFVSMLVSMGLRPDQSELPWLFAWGLPIMLYLLGLVTLAFALASGAKGVGSSKLYIGKVSAVIALVLLVIASLWNPAGPHSHVPGSFAELVRADMMCGAVTLMLGAVPFFLALFTLRRAFPERSSVRSLLVGVSGGVAGAATIQMHCSVAVASHLLLAHAAPVLVYSILGAWIANRVFRT